jgi:dipeptidyl aminopeptidase/acylaminoacyl peptidase
MTSPVPAEEAWRERFRAPAITRTMVARHRPTRGLVVGTQSGSRQLYSWDVPTGERNQLTFRAEGVPTGLISPDGKWIYYHHDRGGDEIGHHVRVPFEGGEPQVVAPGLPAYATSGMAISGTSRMVGLVAADANGFHLYVAAERSAEGFEEPRMVRSTPRPTFIPLLSHDGDLVVVHELRAEDAPRFALVAVDATNGAVIGELWDGPRSSIEASTFCWVPGDTRLLGTSDASGVRRPFVWDPRTGERTDLDLADIEGEVAPTDWSDDGERVLLCRRWNGEQRVLEYDLSAGTFRTVRHGGGSYGAVYEPPIVYYGASGEIWADWQDATHPLELRALEPVRTILSASSVPRSTPWRSVTIPGGGGDVQGWLALPAGDGPHPTVIDMHGGPQSVAIESFSPTAHGSRSTTGVRSRSVASSRKHCGGTSGESTWTTWCPLARGWWNRATPAPIRCS